MRIAQEFTPGTGLDPMGFSPVGTVEPDLGAVVFHPSLRDSTRWRVIPGMNSWAIIARPYGTDSGRTEALGKRPTIERCFGEKCGL